MKKLKTIVLLTFAALLFSPIAPQKAEAQVLDRCEIYLWHMEAYCDMGYVLDCYRWIAIYEAECE